MSTPRETALAIEASGLVKTFGEVKAVDGVDLTVAKGSVYGVLGPNGAGKTTTIRMLATLISPDGGSAKVLGHDIATEGDQVRAKVSLTGQMASVDEPTTGLDPRSRNQVWDIIRALRTAGTTILLCTQYLDEADQLADGIAVIDQGKVIAEGTPAQLKASVGSGALPVRLLDPQQRDKAERILAQHLGLVHLEPDPAALQVQCADA